MTLLEIARAGRLDELRERLAEITASNFRRNGGGHLKVGERLLLEANDYAQRGDLDEATFRLRLRAEPKFNSVQECQSQYNEAMAAKRARASS